MFSWAVKVWLLWLRYFLFFFLLILQFWFGSILELSASFSLSPFSPFNLIDNYSFDNLFSCMMGKFKEILMMRSWSWDYYIQMLAPSFSLLQVNIILFWERFHEKQYIASKFNIHELAANINLGSPQYSKKKKPTNIITN